MSLNGFETFSKIIWVNCKGIIGEKWPYSNIPADISIPFTSGLHSILTVKINENHFIYRKGKTDFNECFKNQHMNSHCVSIFDPRPVKNQ